MKIGIPRLFHLTDMLMKKSNKVVNMFPSQMSRYIPYAGPVARWIDRHILELGRELELSFLPPLMVYLAAGISGLTGIVGTFFVKEYLGLSAEFLAALGFWTLLPWSLKLPVGHVVDLIWRYKGWLVFLGATLVAASLLIMLGLLHYRNVMETYMTPGNWYVMSTLLAPVGYMVQDVVADAMTVEAVPRVDSNGHVLPEEEQRQKHATLQTLGRVSVIGGTLLVAGVNVVMFGGVEALSPDQKALVYEQLYSMALVIPVVSVSGVWLAACLRERTRRSLRELGHTRMEIETLLNMQSECPAPNPWILGGGLAFTGISLLIGLLDIAYGQEILFILSFTIVIGILSQLVDDMDKESRQVLIGTAVLIFVFRAVPGPGAASNWWMIDELGFDQAFMAKLSLIGSVLSLVGLFLFRRTMAEKSIAYLIGVLTIVGTILSLPTLGMYYGLHQWTAAWTGGVVDARCIAIIDTALESPLGQIAMVPMLAWIAHSAPSHLKATFFSVMASFINLALALSQLGTKYLNQVYTVAREIKEPLSGVVKMPADYSQLGYLFIASITLGCIMPFCAIFLVKRLGWRSA